MAALGRGSDARAVFGGAGEAPPAATGASAAVDPPETDKNASETMTTSHHQLQLTVDTEHTVSQSCHETDILPRPEATGHGWEYPSMAVISTSIIAAVGSHHADPDENIIASPPIEDHQMGPPMEIQPLLSYPRDLAKLPVEVILNNRSSSDEKAGLSYIDASNLDSSIPHQQNENEIATPILAPFTVVELQGLGQEAEEIPLSNNMHWSVNEAHNSNLTEKTLEPLHNNSASAAATEPESILPHSKSPEKHLEAVAISSTAGNNVSTHQSESSGSIEHEESISDPLINENEIRETTNADSDGYQSSHLHVDSQENSDADSALGSAIESSTMSMRSSLRDSVEEHGRTYHKYKQGKYYLPNDEVEQDRLDLQHHLFYLSLDGKLNLAPVVNPQLVLDIGTGTGIWAMDFATQNPSAKVIGTDLSAIQPAFIPPNCQFEVDDAEDEWMYTQKFDFIHGRALFSCFKDHKSIFAKAYDALAPGGYLEMQDVWIKPHSFDGTVENTNLSRWYETMMIATKKLGRDFECSQKYRGWFEEVGFVEVRERRFYWPQNTWPKGEKNKTLGLWTLSNVLDAVVSVSTALFIRVLGMSPEAVELMMMGVRKDMKNRNIHCYYPVYVVYGRKPL